MTRHISKWPLPGISHPCEMAPRSITGELRPPRRSLFRRGARLRSAHTPYPCAMPSRTVSPTATGSRAGPRRGGGNGPPALIERLLMAGSGPWAIMAGPGWATPPTLDGGEWNQSGIAFAHVAAVPTVGEWVPGVGPTPSQFTARIGYRDGREGAAYVNLTRRKAKGQTCN
jgi:hypothetical protein